MIRYQTVRHCVGLDPLTIEHDKEPHQAFKSLVSNEIGFWGVISELTPEKVVITTRVLNMNDVVTFTGPLEEMKPLVQAAAAYVQIMATRRDEVLDHAIAQLPKTPSGGTRALDVVNLTPVLIGHSLINVVTLLALDVVPTEELLKTSTDELMAAACLSIELGVPFDEVLASV